MKKRMPQGIAEDNRAIGQQLVELNSWVWPGKQRIKESPIKTMSSQDVPGIPKAVPYEE